jgi:peptidoglycan DL-endopeptidase LytE
MAVRSSARYLAPIALAATIAGTYVIVHDATKSKKKTPTSQSAAGPKAKSGAHRKRAARFYTVKPGDSLTAIAVKTKVDLTTLESLNRHVDPNALQTGQRLRLRR